MPEAIAVCIGINSVNPGHYQGWEGTLRACEADAKDMAKIANSQGFKYKTILTREATRKSVISSIKKAAALLKKGDIFLLTYSGHGGQIRDENGDEWEDALDETWCLYDGQILDDELYALWETFAAGVRILIISDSCHSGTIIRGIPSSIENFTPRLMPFDVSGVIYQKNKTFYDKIIKDHKNKKRADVNIKATILLISSCQDNQLSADGYFNGLFTGKLKKIWNNSKFKGDYRKFHGQIIKRMPPWQSPNYVVLGEPDKKFESQKPFTI